MTTTCGCKRDVKALLHAGLKGDDLPECPNHPKREFDGTTTPVALNDTAGLAAALGAAVTKNNRTFESGSTPPEAA